MLKNGTAAPEFTLRADDGSAVSLRDIQAGRPLLLHFFRGAFCPTARRNLLNLQDVYSRIESMGCGLAAISADTPEDLAALREMLQVDFPLLSDEGFAVSREYGVYQSEDGEGPQPHGEPALFIIDVDGEIAYSQIMTGPKGLAQPAEMALVLFYMSQNGGRY